MISFQQKWDIIFILENGIIFLNWKTWLLQEIITINRDCMSPRRPRAAAGTLIGVGIKFALGSYHISLSTKLFCWQRPSPLYNIFWKDQLFKKYNSSKMAQTTKTRKGQIREISKTSKFRRTPQNYVYRNHEKIC